MSHKGELIKMVKKETSVHDVDALILEKVILLKTAKDKEEKEKLRKQIQRLEKHFNEVNDKHINGKKYPPKDMGYLSDKPMNKTELYKLIEDIDYEDNPLHHYVTDEDLSGVSPNNTRFVYKD